MVDLIIGHSLIIKSRMKSIQMVDTSELSFDMLFWFLSFGILSLPPVLNLYDFDLVGINN